MATKKKSFMVVLEGVDFSGKTTLVAKLKKLLENDEIVRGYFDKIIYTKEPNGECKEFCAEVREVALKHLSISDLTRSLLFFANRCEHINSYVIPEMEKGGCLCICDRFYLSTLVYQAKDNPHLISLFKQIQRTVAPIVPDRTYLLKVSKEVFLERWSSRDGRPKDLLDSKTFEEFEGVNRRYDEFIASDDPAIGPVVYIYSNENENMPQAIEVQKDLQKLAQEFSAELSSQGK